MPPSWELPQQIPLPGNSLDAKAPGCGQIFGANLRVCVGGNGVEREREREGERDVLFFLWSFYLRKMNTFNEDKKRQ